MMSENADKNLPAISKQVTELVLAGSLSHAGPGLFPLIVSGILLSAGEDGRMRCLSNVCTHRGTVVCEGRYDAAKVGAALGL